MESRDRAVVLGGSIAGLLAARVLADSYRSVVIVERDRLSTTGQRRGVPQGEHVHGLLPRGRQIMEELLPGLVEELVAAGAHDGDILDNVRWYVGGRMLRQVPTGLGALSASRPLIERAIRARVTALPNVTVLDGYDSVGLSTSPDRRRVTAARVTSVGGEVSRILPADLVVDATGRGSRATRWVADLGLGPVPEDRVGIDLTYSSRVFEVPADLFGDDIVVATMRHPGQKRSAVMQRLEGASAGSAASGAAQRPSQGAGRVLVTLAGILGERPPGDLEGFLAYASTLAARDTYDVIRAGRPVGEASKYRIPTYVRRRYERLPEFPAGLVVVGDALCIFNPVYAQGMSVAAMNAASLREALAGDLDPARFFAAVAPTVDAPWAISVGADLAVAGVTGPVLPASPLTSEYVETLRQTAVEDAALAAAFIRVTSLVDPPAALLRPEIVDRVARRPDAVVVVATR
jgi:2-polyprenyl-6-methoxyphenol hydroxylase-like FAD-dependent oxidoreductase